MVRVEAAYGLFYLDSRPALIRALELASPPTQPIEVVLRAAVAVGFNAVRPWQGLPEGSADAAGLALFEPPAGTPTFAPAGPFAVSLQAARAAADATEDRPAGLWGLLPDPLTITAAVARGVRAYAVALEEKVLLGDDLAGLASLQALLASREEELTASVEVRDSLVYLDYSPYHRASGTEVLHGAHAVLATSGYNPTLVDLARVADAEIGEFLGAIFPSRGLMELEDYGKLVVFTLRGGTLVTYPVPVRTQPSGAAFKSTFLWPRDPDAPHRDWRDLLPWRRAGRREASALGYTTQVRDGMSTLLGSNFGEPYTGPAYVRLPQAQRIAHREVALSLFEQAVPRSLVPDNSLEVEMVARLSPDGGALLFILNRLGQQTGSVRLGVPEALNVGSPPVVEVLFSGSGSSAAWHEGALSLDVAAGDALILRLT